jgi:hypothetical protein
VPETAERTVHCFGNTVAEVPPELTIVETDAELEQLRQDPNIGIFRCLSPKTGDTRIVWNRMSLAEISAAKKQFLELVKKGMTPYRVGADSKRSSQVMKEFDPHAQEIIFMPMSLVGGG